jgi:DNA-binding PadR family transcriptional regulator
MTEDREPTLTKQTMLVLSILVQSADAAVAGSTIAAKSRLASGSLYPILIRLEQAGWITSEWERDDHSAKPRRRLYSITALGIRRARQEAMEWKQLTERFV